MSVVKVILSIVLVQTVPATILNVESSFFKNNHERSNKVNKKIWVNKYRNSYYDRPQQENNFLFRPPSGDDEQQLQREFNFFDDQNFQKIPSYMQRAKRSSKKRNRNKRLKKNSTKKTTIENNSIGVNTTQNTDATTVNTESTNDKPSSAFSNYPYEVAVFIQINNTMDIADVDQNKTLDKTSGEEDLVKVIPPPQHLSILQMISEEFNQTNQDLFNLNESTNRLPNDSNSPNNKRSMILQVLDNDFVKNLNITEIRNGTSGNGNKSKVSRNIFDKDLPAWQQNAPLPEVHSNLENKYFHENHLLVVPKPGTPASNKPITEGGLLKILSMLTRTFRKVMQQHESINKAHAEVSSMSSAFRKDYEDMNKKMAVFNSRYNFLIQYSEKLKEWESNFNIKEETFMRKQKQFSDNLSEFENQQKKFLSQQRQFYNIQKLMLAQNEKINSKQATIVKSQSEISIRQNTFAQVLKRFKQTHAEPKPKTAASYLIKATPAPAKKEKFIVATPPATTPLTPTTAPPTTPVMKINLMSMAHTKKYENNDKNMLNENDFHAIDDIVYKYYFNNTFIDNLIKSRILNGFSVNENFGPKRNIIIKNKRNNNDLGIETTVLLPIGNTETSLNPNTTLPILNRHKRWLNHHSRRKYKKKYPRFTAAPKASHQKSDKAEKINQIAKDLDYDINLNLDLVPDKLTTANFAINDVDYIPKMEERGDDDPFHSMASNFCTQIGQNLNDQTLSWCIEKTIRKLKFMHKKFQPIAVNTVTMPDIILLTSVQTETNADVPLTTTWEPVTSETSTAVQQTNFTESPPATNAVKATLNNMHFPDNDALESNLKQYEITPDVDGNVYYESSFHVSDVSNVDSGSDYLPGIDSNSRIDLDPLTLDLQAKRRAYVQRLNEKILHRISQKKLKA